VSVYETVVTLPAFRGCATTDLQAFVAAAPPVRFKAASQLIRQGEAARGAFLVVHGHCRAEVQADGRSTVVGRAGPGDIVGELGLFASGLTRSATVTAEDEVQALLLTQDLLADPAARTVLDLVELRALSTLAERVRRSHATRSRVQTLAPEPQAAPTLFTRLRRLLGA